MMSERILVSYSFQESHHKGVWGMEVQLHSIFYLFTVGRDIPSGITSKTYRTTLNLNTTALQSITFPAS
jgi:hypothetical protein